MKLTNIKSHIHFYIYRFLLIWITTYGRINTKKENIITYFIYNPPEFVAFRFSFQELIFFIQREKKIIKVSHQIYYDIIVVFEQNALQNWQQTVSISVTDFNECVLFGLNPYGIINMCLVLSEKNARDPYSLSFNETQMYASRWSV